MKTRHPLGDAKKTPNKPSTRTIREGLFAIPSGEYSKLKPASLGGQGFLRRALKNFSIRLPTGILSRPTRRQLEGSPPIPWEVPSPRPWQPCGETPEIGHAPLRETPSTRPCVRRPRPCRSRHPLSIREVAPWAAS
jgi:hypothetical protein